MPTRPPFLAVVAERVAEVERHVWGCLEQRLRPLWAFDGPPSDSGYTPLFHYVKRMTPAVFAGLGDCRPFFEEMFGLPSGSLVPHHKEPNEEAGGLAERLLDFTMRSWEPAIERLDFEPLAVPKPYGIALAAESEWGKYNSPETTFRMVLDDFLKLLDVQAPVKVVVYGCFLDSERGNAESVRARFEYVLRTLSGYTPGEVWLFAGFPWWGNDTWAVRVHVARAGSDGLRVTVPEWWPGPDEG
ncbi:hypothetical protein [Urbifossiella limnaea]|uniref:Uncharacterized protein n=1 Tax=Urbifossiella limnaea TaxID=2528023 RepID=A0A517XLU6_9BACT|nr:hypothetical protein [Urbifossiella limnaea]QDU18478.1 hypothetical protein ETAA1_03660 [Urbifossiella limnaea]